MPAAAAAAASMTIGMCAYAVGVAVAARGGERVGRPCAGYVLESRRGALAAGAAVGVFTYVEALCEPA